MSNSTTASPLPQPHLTPLPPFLPPIPDSILLLLLPIIIYWTLSLFFHVLDTYDLLAQYRLHTPEELLKRNHVTRREVIRDVILQQIIQTIIGGAMALLEGVDMTGNEAAEIQTVYRVVVLLQRGVVGVLALLGVDAVGVAAATGMPDLKYQAAEVVYWYLLPVARIGVAIFVLDTWQYFLHRLMHEVKWLYRTIHPHLHLLLSLHELTAPQEPSTPATIASTFRTRSGRCTTTPSKDCSWTPSARRWGTRSVG